MKRVAILFALFIITIIILADMDHLPRVVRVIYDFPNGDKAGHFVLFGLLNLFTTLAFTRSLPDRTSKQVALTIGFILALLIGLEEFSQQLFATRTFDLIDLLASYAGVAVGGWMAVKAKRP